jgi:ATP-dependent Clp protease ATP-binding subunit ClpA
MPDHLKDGLVAHFSLLAMSHKRQQEEIQAYQREIKAYQEEMKALERRQEEEMKTMRGEIDQLKKQSEPWRSNMQIIPIDFRVETPRRYTSINPWSSTPFYSHTQGYKLQINFYNKPMWDISFIYCSLMRGDFDVFLDWPLKAVMKLALLNEQPQGKDYEFSIELKCSKPLGDKSDAVECGSHSLGSITLDPYLRSGCVHIRIVSIQF